MMASPTEQLRQLCARRSRAATPEDLRQIETDLEALVETAKSGSVWIDAGLKLATLMLQRGQEELAESLIAERGTFTVRLSNTVLTGCALQEENASLAGVATISKPFYGRQTVGVVYQNPLGRHLENTLEKAFAPGAPYWEKHDYADGSDGRPPSPYFSYVIPLSSSDENKGATQSVLEALTRRVRDVVSEHFPAAQTAGVAEVWAHCRPHCSGHQLHFDSDAEGETGVHNPIVSTVLFLGDATNDKSGNEGQDDLIGGPTLLTSQSQNATRLAKQGWLCFPKRHRLLAFKGDLLHGVVPGAGAKALHSSHKRITLMIAFWDHIESRTGEKPCAAQPFPKCPDQQAQAEKRGLVDLAAAFQGSAECSKNECTVAQDGLVHVQEVWHNLGQDNAAPLAQVLPPYEQIFQWA